MNMNSKKSTPSDQFLDALTDELIAMSDEQVLEGADANSIQAAWLARLSKAKAEAGRRRLAAAKNRASAARSRHSVCPTPPVSAEEARWYVANAANDMRYTMAARNLNEMSDEDILRLYTQLKRLEAQGDTRGEPNA